MNGHQHAKSASQTKDRNYAHLSKSLARLSRAMGQTADLFEQLHLDLDAMRTLAGIHSAQFMTVAAELNPGRNADVE
ncbi:hypothetical protein B0F90DRAFT_1624235 [Multifurca ochricompacta]|uniref:Uncharacterized protein n=1 Tax=Multifurca ochricompacta TaxID=376703 RepID=A0AAD4M9H5_9AGAM|nr:hypothetical protein B0F90DRAFT_1624235 [Multifurca ochricompacta]